MPSTDPSSDPGDPSDPAAFAELLLRRYPAARAVALADPQDPDAPLAAGDLVLGLGLSGAAVGQVLSRAGAAAVAAVLLRRPAPVEVARWQRQAAAEGVELCWLPAELGWSDLHRHLVDRLVPPAVSGDDELADLAQTIATLTGGLVTIEDTSARVLAYSRSSDEVDDLRRLSILGRSGPADYLALLRDWGVYDRLSSSEEVIEIAEHPETGVRRRLAVGVFADDRQLATIWVQRGSAEFEPHARQALLGAARVTAAQLVSHGARSADRRAGTELARLLTGRPTNLPGQLGRAARRPCAVAVAELDDEVRDPATSKLRLDELASIVTMHAAALRRNAVVEPIDGRVYLLLPSMDSVNSATTMLGQAVAAARRHLDPATRSAIGPVVDSVAAAGHSRRGADRALAIASTEPVISFDAARSRLVTSLIENSLYEQPDLIDPRTTLLIQDDPEGARTLLRYLDAGSDAARVAADLHVHPSTVRYRLRRVVETTGIDLQNPEDRLAVHVQLRCGLRRTPSGG